MKAVEFTRKKLKHPRKGELGRVKLDRSRS